MWTRRLPLILALAVLPALAACGTSETQAPEPLTDAAITAVDPKPGISRRALARAVDNLFADEEAGETRALLVYHRGRLVAERYGEGFGAGTRLVGWSMTKAVTGVMIGMLVGDGRLRLDETVPIPAWQRSGDPRGEITLRHLLQMRSGLRHTEEDEPIYAADVVRMAFLDGRDNMAAYAEAQPLEAVPGRMWEYSSASTVILADLAARVLSDGFDPVRRRAAVADYLQTRVFRPLGMSSMVPEFDAAGTFAGSGLLHGTARDWGRFGEFLRSGGAVKGAQVVPRGWIEFMTHPSPRNPGYGAQVWLNRPQPDSGGEVLFPGAPRDVIACIGHLGQYIVVSPRQDLTVVRMGKNDDDQRAAVRRRLASIAALFPKR